MKGTLAFLMAFLIFSASLVPQLDIEELAKLPNLVHHYKEHSKTENISFLAFMSLHYNENSKHAQSTEHAKLPFFSHEMPNLVFVIIPTVVLPVISLDHVFNTYFTHVNHYFFISEISLFQPPQAA